MLSFLEASSSLLQKHIQLFIFLFCIGFEYIHIHLSSSARMEWIFFRITSFRISIKKKEYPLLRKFYRILLSTCTSANSGKIHVYLLKDAVGWKNLLSERNTSSSFGFPIHSLSTKKLPIFTMQRLIISSYEFYIQEKF